MSEPEPIEYPQAHPKHVEIAEIKKFIDESFTEYKKQIDQARFQYKIADTSLKEMGSALKKSQELLEAVAPKLQELEELATLPLI